MDIYLAKTQGFCAGVSYAIAIVDKALETYGAPLYVYHEIVHNTHVVESFKNNGVVFVEDLADVPEGSVVIFSAHGVPPSVLEEVQKRHLHYVDATCPLVGKVHHEAIKASRDDIPTILIGHKGHQEIVGTAGYVKPELLHIVENIKDIDALAIDDALDVTYITQTTLSVDETADMIARLKEKFPRLISPPNSDLCYATQNRQDAVKELAQICDMIIICGSPNSSNSNRLRETGENLGCESYIVDSADEFDLETLVGKQKIGISSGASVPREIVDQLVSKIQGKYSDAQVHTFENPEKDIVFRLPQV